METSTVSPTKAYSTWTIRDEEILEALALKCRVLEQREILRHWWKEGSDRGRKRLQQYCSAGLVNRYRVMAHPMLQMSEPVTAWQPGQANSIDCEAVSYQLRARWKSPSTSLMVYTASAKTAALFGRPGRYRELPKVLEMTHDLHVGQVYLRYLRVAPERAKEWVGEDVLGKAGKYEKDPDAFLIRESGVRYCAVEFGGRYDPLRVAAFHGYCYHHQIEYELW